jgi:hypothetical protein
MFNIELPSDSAIPRKMETCPHTQMFIAAFFIPEK